MQTPQVVTMPEASLTAEEYEQLLQARADHRGRIDVRTAIDIIYRHAEAAQTTG